MTISLSLKVCLHTNWYLIKNVGASLLWQKLHVHTLFVRKSFTSFCQLLGYIFVHLMQSIHSSVCLVLGWHLNELNAKQKKNSHWVWWLWRCHGLFIVFYLFSVLDGVMAQREDTPVGWPCPEHGQLSGEDPMVIELVARRYFLWPRHKTWPWVSQ